MEGSDSPLGLRRLRVRRGGGRPGQEIEVDGGNGCVAPSAETIADGSYPLSRSLYIYVNNGQDRDNPAVKAFVDFYLSDDSLTDARRAGRVRRAPGGPDPTATQAAPGTASRGARGTEDAGDGPSAGGPLRHSSDSRTRSWPATTVVSITPAELTARQPRGAAEGADRPARLQARRCCPLVDQPRDRLRARSARRSRGCRRSTSSGLWADGWFPRANEFDMLTILRRDRDDRGHRDAGRGAARPRRGDYLSEYASPGRRRTLKPILEILAGDPERRARLLRAPR